MIAENRALLISKGMKESLLVLLRNSFAEMTEQSNLQTALMKEKVLLTDGNNASYEALYDVYISDVCTIREGSIFRHGKGWRIYCF